jgi:hypothetical protein
MEMNAIAQEIVTPEDATVYLSGTCYGPALKILHDLLRSSVCILLLYSNEERRALFYIYIYYLFVIKVYILFIFYDNKNKRPRGHIAHLSHIG